MSPNVIDGADNVAASIGRLGEVFNYFDTTISQNGNYAPPFQGQIEEIEDLISTGSPSAVYDVIIQPGHYGRTKGSTGSQGANVSEQQIAASISARLASRLKELGYDVLVIAADDFSKPLTSYVFLAIHADGSDNPCASAPSLGYDDGSDLLGMHLVAYALGTSLGYHYSDFMKDNFTVNLTDYYAYKHMKTRVFEGVLEIGELTCPAEDNIAYALDSAVTIAKSVGK